MLARTPTVSSWISTIHTREEPLLKTHPTKIPTLQSLNNFFSSFFENYRENNVLVSMALHKQHQEDACQNCSPRRACRAAWQPSSCSRAHAKEPKMLCCTSSHFPAAMGNCGTRHHAKARAEILRGADKHDSEASKALFKVFTYFSSWNAKWHHTKQRRSEKWWDGF